MNSLECVWVLLRATLAVSLALLLVVAVRRMCRNFLHPHARYAVWSAIPLSLIASALPSDLFVGKHTVALPLASLQIQPSQATPDTATLIVSQRTKSDAAWLTWVVPLWGIGAFGLGLIYISRYQAWQRRARTAQVDSACVIGVLRPHVLLPNNFERRYSPEQRQLIIAHEHHHIRRGDPLWNALAGVLHSLFWFHPAMPMALRAYRDDQEMSCDAAIVARQPSAIATYAAALSTEAGCSDYPLQCQWQPIHPFLERITMLKKIQQRKLSITLSAAVCASLIPFIFIASNTFAGATSSPSVNAMSADASQALHMFGVHIKKNGESIALPAIGTKPGEAGSVTFGDDNARVELTLSAENAGNNTLVNVYMTFNGKVLMQDTLTLTPSQNGRATLRATDPNSNVYDIDLALRLMTADQLQTKPDSLPFPRAAQMLNLDGRVLLRVELDALGNVVNAEVKSAQPKNVFDRAALDTIKKRNFGAQQVPQGQSTVWRETPLVFKNSN